MRTVIAALDASPAARPVLETAQRTATITGTTVEAIHVREDAGETPRLLAERAEVPIRLIDGPVESALVTAVAEPSVALAVVGARATPSGRRPVGRTALHLLEAVDKPIVVVPPETVGRVSRPLRRLLIPLEGNDESSRPVAVYLGDLLTGEVELVVLHVFTPTTVPGALDRSRRDLSLWGDEFLARYCPGATSLELRTGSVGDGVAEVRDAHDVDMVVLSWSQDSTPGHAAVVRDVLARSTVPVLLLPVGRHVRTRG